MFSRILDKTTWIRLDLTQARWFLRLFTFFSSRRLCGREQAIKAAAGFVRIEVESALSRGGRGGNTGGGGFHVAGGNYYSAKPIGVRNGLDYGCSGEVRKVEADRIRYASVDGCYQVGGGGYF